MAISQKYGRTYHYPFSPGTTSDDRIAHDYWEHLQRIPNLIHTEKMDGENNCLSKHGVHYFGPGGYKVFNKLSLAIGSGVNFGYGA